jgi:hypothetical protein
MTAREEILAKPGRVQVVIQVFMTKASLNDPAPDYEKYAREALEDWKRWMVDAPPGGELELAESLVRWMRAHPVWGKILRKDTQ